MFNIRICIPNTYICIHLHTYINISSHVPYHRVVYSIFGHEWKQALLYHYKSTISSFAGLDLVGASIQIQPLFDSILQYYICYTHTAPIHNTVLMFSFYVNISFFVRIVGSRPIYLQSLATPNKYSLRKCKLSGICIPN